MTIQMLNPYVANKLLDGKRQMSNFFKRKELMTDELYEYRYESSAGEYRLKCWHDGKEHTDKGKVADQPEWLTSIVDVAKVAGHTKSPITPPPETILWFNTDANHTLTNFIELT